MWYDFFWILKSSALDYRENGTDFEGEGVGGGDSAFSPSGSEELEGFKCQDVLQPRVFYPFLLILVLMFLLQVLKITSFQWHILKT